MKRIDRLYKDPIANSLSKFIYFSSLDDINVSESSRINEIFILNFNEYKCKINTIYGNIIVRSKLRFDKLRDYYEES